VTTIALIHFSDTVNEANVLVRAAVETFGQAGLVGLKLAVLLTCLGISVSAANDEDAFSYYLPPLVLTVVGAFTTTYNVRLLLG
jgi:branched-subunit amino acid permease